MSATNTLTFSNLNSTSYSTNTSVGGGVSLSQKHNDNKTTTGASSISYNASNGMSYSKDKTLATLGSGTVNISEKENSDSMSKLNRNKVNGEARENALGYTDNLTKELLHGGVSSDVSATIDMRMFTEDGRKDIAEDFYRSGEFIDATAEVITNEGSAGEQLIDATKQLRDRLMSLGLMIGEEIEVVEATLMRQTFKILVGDSFVAIREEEATRIFVKAI